MKSKPKTKYEILTSVIEENKQTFVQVILNGKGTQTLLDIENAKRILYQYRTETVNKLNKQSWLRLLTYTGISL